MRTHDPDRTELGASARFEIFVEDRPPYVTVDSPALTISRLPKNALDRFAIRSVVARPEPRSQTFG